MADHRVLLGIDLGTTAVKVVAAGLDGQPREITERGVSMAVGASGAATQDPDEVLLAAERALADCVAACVAAGRSIVGVCFSTALHTLLALDAHGQPVTPVLSWADLRAARTATAIDADVRLANELRRATGTPIHPMSPLVKLAYFTEHEPDIGRVARHWVGIKDYLLLRWTGRLVTDHSSASATGLLDVHRLHWHPAALRRAGITEDRLPELCAPTERLALCAGIGGLPAGLPVVAGAGDGPLASLGAGAARPGMAALSLGTSGAFRVIQQGQPSTDARGRTFCYALADALWVVGGAVSNGGVVTAWAADTFGVELADLLTEAAQADAADIVALPYLLGERAPWWDPAARSVLLGLRREHGRGQIVRAMIEGVGQQLALVAAAVSDVGVQLDRVRATGGAFRSALWGTVLAAALDRELELTNARSGSALGAALLGWRALDELDSLAAAAELVKPTRTITPNPDLARRLARRRPLVERVYRALSELAAELTE